MSPDLRWMLILVRLDIRLFFVLYVGTKWGRGVHPVIQALELQRQMMRHSPN